MHEKIARLAGIFDVISERAICFYENRVVYLNKSANLIFQDDPIGISLSSVVGAENAKKLEAARENNDGIQLGGVQIDGHDYNIRAVFIDEILLLILTPLTLPERELNVWAQHAIASASNEFRSPLNNLISALNLISSKFSNPQDEKLLQYLAIMNQNCYKLIRLSNNINDLAQFSGKTAVFSPTDSDIAGLCKRVVAAAAPLALTKDIKIEYKSPPAPLITNFDTDKVERMLLNLISNSIKYTREGNIITVKVSKSKENVFINVSDSGAGMSSQVLAAVLRRFLPDCEPEEITPETVCGLGLPLVYAITHLHNGTVALESREGEGTSVTISLPLISGSSDYVRSYVVDYDYTGGFSHVLVELSDALPFHVFTPGKIPR